MGLQNNLRALQRCDIVVEVNHVDRRPLGFGHQSHLGFDDRRQGALRADNHT